MPAGRLIPLASAPPIRALLDALEILDHMSATNPHSETLFTNIRQLLYLLSFTTKPGFAYIMCIYHSS